VVVIREWPIAALTLARSIPAGDEQRAVSVAEVMEAKRLEPGCISRTLEPAAQGRRIQPTAISTGEHVVVWSCELATTPQAFEGGCRLIGQGNLPGPTTLRRAHLGIA
jgi:hypothetical protein